MTPRKLAIAVILTGLVASLFWFLPSAGPNSSADDPNKSHVASHDGHTGSGSHSEQSLEATNGTYPDLPEVPVSGDTPNSDRAGDSVDLPESNNPLPELFIEGQVVTEDGVSLAGAEVVVFPYRGAQFTKQALQLFQRLKAGASPIATGSADRSGYFRVGIPAPGEYLVAASFDRRSSATEGPIPINLRETSTYLIFTLPPGVSIEGKVLSPTGGRLAGVPLVLLEKEQTGRRTYHTHRTTSDDNGGFLFQGLEARSYILMAKGDGHPGRLMQQVEAPTRDLLVRLDDVRELMGQVIEAQTGRPIAGALLTAVNPISYDQTTSEEDGTFSLELSGDDVDVLVSHPDYLIFEKRVTLNAEETEQTIELARGREVRGRIVRNDGTPVPGALVGVLQRAWLRGDVRTTTADENGNFTVSVQGAGTDLILARVPGWVPTLTQSQLNTNGDTPQDLVLQPTRDFHGVVLSATGRPVPGAWIRLHPAANDERFRQAVFWMRGDIEGWSDEDGNFVVRDVIPYLPYQVEVRHPDHPDTWGQIASLPTEPYEIILTEGSELELAIRTPEGRPPPTTIVIAQWAGGPPVRRGRNGNLEGGSRFIAGSDGFVVMRSVPAGRLELYVIAPSYVEERLQLDVTEGQSLTAEVNLRPSGSLLVRVVDGSGLPVPAAQLTLQGPAASGARAYLRRARTGVEGLFTFSGMAPGRYQVSVSGNGSATAQNVEVSAEQETEVEVELGS